MGIMGCLVQLAGEGFGNNENFGPVDQYVFGKAKLKTDEARVDVH